MTTTQWLLIAVFAALCAFSVFVFAVLHLYRIIRRAIERNKAAVEDLEKAVHYAVCTYTKDFRADFYLGSQSSVWATEMRKIGERLYANKVSAIGLFHGTFVGTDPVGFLTFLRQQNVPGSEPLVDRLQQLLKRSIDKVARDVGNFTEDYRQLLEQALGRGISVNNVHWPSGNYHAARLKGAIVALDWIYRHAGLNAKSSNRLLLVGHSHAGQVFALLTRMMHKSESLTLLKHAEQLFGTSERKFREQQLELLRGISIDFVTLGTTPVYAWCLTDKQRLLHIINHRGKEPSGGSLLGVLHTRGGDYVQQFAHGGTDALALGRSERQLNVLLDELLGKGITWQRYPHIVREKRRLHSDGTTCLVDFQDASSLLPNAIQTFFGHGIYTRGGMMLPLWELIVRQLYRNE